MNRFFHRGRLWVTRVVWGLVLVVLAPLPDVLEWLWPGWGRRYAQRNMIRGVPRLMRDLEIEIDVVGATPRSSEPCVYVCNHRTVFDPVALFAALGNVRLVVARPLFEVPILGRVLRNMDAVAVDTENPHASVASFDALARLGLDRSVVIFPEGRLRTAPRLLPFQTGAFFLAIRAGVPVVPVVVEGTEDAFTAHARNRVAAFESAEGRQRRLRDRPSRARWVRIKARLRHLLMPIDEWNAAKVTVRVLDPIPTDGLTTADRRLLSSRVRIAMEQALASGRSEPTSLRLLDTPAASGAAG